MNVIVVGAGLAGLGAAIGLAQDGHEVTVMERAAEMEAVGAGISIWPNALRALEELGVADDVQRVGVPFASTEIRDRRGRSLNKLDPGVVLKRLGRQPLMVHRAELQSLLLHAACEADVQLGAAVVAARTSATGAVVELADGMRLDADLVVGADGARSAIRRVLDPSPPRVAGPVAWRAVVSSSVVVEDAWLSVADGHQFLATPMTNGRVYVSGLVDVQDAAVPHDELLLRSVYAGWHEPIPQLLASVTDVDIRWDQVLHRFAPRRMYAGRVVLIGDAAHPMTPDLGQGGCQAMEDAVLLASALRHASSIDAALARFERLRRPRVRRVVNESRRIGTALALRNPTAVRMRDASMRVIPQSAALTQLARNASVRSFERQLTASAA